MGYIPKDMMGRELALRIWRAIHSLQTNPQPKPHYFHPVQAGMLILMLNLSTGFHSELR